MFGGGRGQKGRFLTKFRLSKRKQNKKKKNCGFLLTAASINCFSDSDPRIEVEVAELLVGHDLVVNGIFEMSHLTPGKKYEIFYMLYFKNPPAFEPRFSVTLQLPKGKPIVIERPLKIGPEGRAVVEGGEFVASADGQVKFSLANPDHLEWKKGLTIVGVSIRKSRLDAVV